MMDISRFLPGENEQPLDRIVDDGGFTAIFRTIACVGDSLSSGEFESTNPDGSKGYHDMFEYSWGQYIARMTGSKVYNFSRGGMSAREYADTFALANDFWNPAYRSRAYIYALGVNDMSLVMRGDFEFGSIDDVDPDNYANCKRTFAGDYGRVLARYHSIAPDAFTFLVTAPRDGSDENRSALYDKHQELMYAFAEKFPRTYVLDIRKYGPDYDAAFKKNFYLGGHLNACGYQLTAKMFASYIDYIVRHNMREFSQVGFIGTPFRNTEGL